MKNSPRITLALAIIAVAQALWQIKDPDPVLGVIGWITTSAALLLLARKEHACSKQ